MPLALCFNPGPKISAGDVVEISVKHTAKPKLAKGHVFVYRFSLGLSVDELTVLSDYTPSPVCTWSPLQAGVYTIQCSTCPMPSRKHFASRGRAVAKGKEVPTTLPFPVPFDSCTATLSVECVLKHDPVATPAAVAAPASSSDASCSLVRLKARVVSHDNPSIPVLCTPPLSRNVTSERVLVTPLWRIKPAAGTALTSQWRVRRSWYRGKSTLCDPGYGALLPIGPCPPNFEIQGVSGDIDLPALGFEPYGDNLMVRWPPVTGQRGADAAPGPSQQDLDTLLEGTPYAPQVDRVGTLHRVYLPDHDYYLESVVCSVTAGFEDDALIALTVLEQTYRLKCISTLSREMVRNAARYGSLWTLVPEGSPAHHPSACIVCSHPGFYKQFSTLRMTRVMPVILGSGDMRRAMGLMDEIGKRHPALTDANHIYIGYICTPSTRRGQGVGSILMDKLKALCDHPAHLTELYLENSKEANLGFYHGRHGMQVYERLDLTRASGLFGCVKYYVMKRTPGAQDVPLCANDQELDAITTPVVLKDN
ncbi:hypothetical protein KIPB_002408 [Kipferlia bialata]|uniref:N-acetyltransferase domain-containing protein n=1 Tax=Kipferlia bialata TaxID=797122 RepID=A0A9K3GFY5_9EUKA|nr:hypothetical protein KIPB_002408 [Kipferlia bialata]|eukprot:g2408.t1